MSPLTIIKWVLMAVLALIAYFSWSRLVPGLHNVWVSAILGIVLGSLAFFFAKRALNPPK